MAKKTKTEEDWFLRGGERPQETPPGPSSGVSPDGDDADVVDCPHCGGENLASEEYCTHCGRPLRDDDDGDDNDDKEERDFMVTLTRTKTISQKTTVRVSAATVDEAMDRAEDEAPDVGGDWEDVPDSEEYGDVEASGSLGSHAAARPQPDRRRV